MHVLLHSKYSARGEVPGGCDLTHRSYGLSIVLVPKGKPSQEQNASLKSPANAPCYVGGFTMSLSVKAYTSLH